MDNAIKYTPPGGRVTLRWGVTRLSAHGMEQAFLELEDNGPGVPVDARALVLERFYRVPGTMVDGNGLGLPIAEEIARLHHSRLHFESGAGGGCGSRCTCQPRLNPSKGYARIIALHPCAHARRYSYLQRTTRP